MEQEIDTETLVRMCNYCGGDPRQPRKITVEDFSEYGSADWSLSEFQAIIARTVESIPFECRDTALVELEGGYEESTVLKITYTRMTTPEECASRTADALAYVRNGQRAEREQYERLKAKFEK